MATQLERYSLGFKRHRRAAARTGDQAVVGGLRWLVPPDDRSPNGFSDSILHRQWLPLAEIVRARQLAVGTAMLDIGANIGATSIPRAVLGDFQVIYAAEPAPANYGALVYNVAANGLQGFVIPDNVAIGAHDGEATLELGSGIGNHALAPAAPPNGGPARTGKPTVPVLCRTLDTWVKELGVDLEQVTFVKSDCQGWDGYVLAGATEILRRKHIAWQIEVWPRGLARSGFRLSELLAFLREHFSHFIDIGRRSESPRARPLIELRTALAYLDALPDAFTELLLYNASEAWQMPARRVRDVEIAPGSA